MNIALGILALLAIGWFLYMRRGDTSSADARRLVSQGARLVDVRSQAEYQGGHLDGAVNIPVDQLPQRTGQVGKKDRPVVVYCHSGARSAHAARILRAAGFTSVHNLGSMSRW